MHLFDALTAAIEHAADQWWILLVLYLLCTIDGFFPPLPSESIVIALASLSVSGDAVSLWWVVPIAAAGAMTGDLIAFAIGRRIPLHRVRWFRSGRGRSMLHWAEEQLRVRGGVFILSARYVPVGRVAVNMTAGSVGFPLRRFIAFDAVAAVMWAVYGVLIGTVAGAIFEDNSLLSIGVGVVGGVLIGFLLDKVLKLVGIAPAELHPRDGGPQADSEPDRRDAETEGAGPIEAENTGPVRDTAEHVEPGTT